MERLIFLVIVCFTRYSIGNDTDLEEEKLHIFEQLVNFTQEEFQNDTVMDIVLRSVENNTGCHEDACKCLTTEKIFSILHGNISLHQFNFSVTYNNIGEISLLIIYYYSDPISACATFNQTDITYDYIHGIVAADTTKTVLNALITIEANGEDHDEHDHGEEDHHDHDHGEEDHDDHDHDHDEEDHHDHDEEDHGHDEEDHDDHDHDEEDHHDHDEEDHHDHDHDEEDHDDHDEEDDDDHAEENHDDHDEEDHNAHDHGEEDHDDDHDHDEEDHDDHDHDEEDGHDEEDHHDHDEEDHDHGEEDHDHGEEDHDDHDHDEEDPDDHGHDEHNHDKHECIDLHAINKLVNTFADTASSKQLMELTRIYITVHSVIGTELRRSCNVTENPLPQDMLLYILQNFESEDGKIDFGEVLKKLEIGSDQDHDSGGHEGHDHDSGDHEGHDHERRKRRSQFKRERRSSHNTQVTDCYSAEQLLSIYGYEAADSLTLNQFSTICPALIQQQLAEVCMGAETSAEEANSISEAEVYVYSLLSVLLISCCALLGVFLLPCIGKSMLILVMAFLVALAAGTLATDALLHLLPEAFGLHSHGAGHDHSHDEGLVVEDYVYKGLAVLAAFFGFFLMESLMTWISGAGDNGHSHSEQRSYAANHDQAYAETADKLSNLENLERNGDISNSTNDVKNHKSGEHNLCAVKPIAWMVLIGDAVHNFADGMAIGAAFSLDAYSGLSTSLAVLCHELPHELGDFAVLINSNMTIKKAAGLNFISALTAVIGAIVGILLSSLDEARVWIFTVAGGMFLYIALANLIPELVSMQRNSRGGVIFLLQVLGYLTGVGLLVLLVLYENQIKI